MYCISKNISVVVFRNKSKSDSLLIIKKLTKEFEEEFNCLREHT